MLNNKYIDLHIHSNNSDGTFSPNELMCMARANGVGIISITDHDSIDALNNLSFYSSTNMLYINGIEFSSIICVNGRNEKIHILGYGFNEDDRCLKKLVDDMRNKRIKAHLKVIEDIENKIGEISKYETGLLEINKYCWFDRIVINYLESIGYPKDTIEDLRKNYKLNRFSYGTDYELNYNQVIDTIHNAGGYAIFAHPMAYRFSTDKDLVLKIINELTCSGIDGLESYQSDCSFEDTMWLNLLADDRRLLISVGSDFHKLINTDGRQIGSGINNNLCVTETSLTDRIVKEKKYRMVK